MNKNRHRLKGAVSRAAQATTRAAVTARALHRLSTLSLTVVASLAMPTAAGVGSFRRYDAVGRGVTGRTRGKVAIGAGARTCRADCTCGGATGYPT